MAAAAKTPGATPAMKNVVRRPIASATGPARAIETGIRLTETKKSSEATRPSSSGGTRRWSNVPQMTIGPEKRMPRTSAARTTTHRWTLASVEQHPTDLGALPVETWRTTDLETAETTEFHLAGDVVLSAPDLELTRLDSPPTL